MSVGVTALAAARRGALAGDGQRHAAPRCRTADGACARRRARATAAAAARRRGARRPSPPWSSAASRTSRSPISPAAAPSGRSSSRSAPGVLIPRPDSETLIEAAVAHFGDSGPAHDPRSRHRPGHAAARRARPMAGRARARRRRFGARARYAPAQCRAARPGRPRRIPARRLGRRDRGALRPDPVQPALYRGQAPRCRATSRD